MEKQEQKRKTRRILFAILLLALLLRLILFIGPRVIDHFHIAQYADGLTRGEYHGMTNAQGLRHGIIATVACCKTFFGFNDFSMALPFLAAALGCILLTFRIGSRLFDDKTGLIAAFLLSIFPLFITHATLPYPDMVGAFFSFLALDLYFSVNDHPDSAHRRHLFAGLSIGFGFLCKMTTVFMVPVIGLMVFMKRKWDSSLLLAPVGMAAMLLFDLVIAWFLTGNPLHRYEVSGEIAETAIRDIFFPTSEEIRARMLWEVPSHLFFPFAPKSIYLLFFPWLFLPAAFFLRRDPKARAIIGASLVLLLCIWIWPIKLFPYIPALIMEGRHFTLLAVPFCLLIAAWMNRIPGKASVFLAVFLALSSVAAAVHIRDYLRIYDKGERIAFQFVTSKDATRILTHENHKPLLEYLNRFKRKPEISVFHATDAGSLNDAWLILDDRNYIRNSTEDKTKTFTPDLLPGLAGWEKVREFTINHRQNPLKRILGEEPKTYRIHVYHRP